MNTTTATLADSPQRRWRAGDYENPRLLRAVRRWSQKQPDPQAYGHLRPPSPAT